MNNFLDWFTNWFIGEWGRALLELINNNFTVFLIIVGLYGLLLLHAKLTFNIFLPRRLEKMVQTRINKDSIEPERMLYKELVNAWEKELSQLPFYYLVPSKNELWIKRPTKEYRDTQLLYFTNDDKTGTYDHDLIREAILKYKSIEGMNAQ